MKKKFYFATLVIAALSFTGCANDEYVGDQQKLGEQNGAIGFSTKSTNTVRAESTESTGKNAAEKLNYQFWVYGTKTVAGSENPPEDKLVFKDYKVVYSDGSKSPSNTKGWEYVIPGTTQTIKYWDYSASKYDFEAYSYKTGNGSVQRITEEQVYLEKKLIKGDYEVTQLSSPKDLYFAEKKTVTKSDNNYKDAVQLNFQSVLSKIRVGFYETIPGYSVKIDGFYPPQSAETPNGFADASNTESKNFFAWCPNKAANTDHPFVVKYGNDGIPAVTKAAETTGGSYYAFNDDGYTLDAQLTLGTNLLTQNQIGETSSAVTWDNIDNNKKPIYTYFIPQNQLQEVKVQPMKIKVDYTLTSIDGSGEKIKVTGATATVPKEYVAWKANTAYTYIFKISDKTNGSTGGEGGTEGLYPITFDAVVVDYANEGSITTVSTPSVTAKQDGATNGYVTTDGIVFQKGKTIDLKVMNGNADVTSSASITGGYITENYDYGKTPEQNLKAHSQSQDFTTNQSNPLALQNSEGYWVLKVTVGNSTTYVIIRVGNAAEQGPENPANS